MFYADPSLQKAHVLFFYRNFMAKNPVYCHVGLGINAIHSIKVLRRNKVRADAYGVWEPEDIAKQLQATPDATHAIIEAPWIHTHRMARLLVDFPSVHFIVRSHSQIGFLQVEPGAVEVIRESMILQEGTANFSVAANSRRLVEFLEQTYQGYCLYLPNLYDLERSTRRIKHHHHHETIRVGSFGALRILKNHTTAAAAAMLLAQSRGSNLEFWISVDREEHGKGVLHSLRNMFKGLPWAQLIEHKWQAWPEFRRTISHMNLCIQASMTETFNIVTADAAAELVPSVVSSAIEWAPESWKADIDDAEDVARIAGNLLSSPKAGDDGLRALTSYVRESTDIWMDYLAGSPANHRRP